MKKKLKRIIFKKFFKEFEKVQGPRIIYTDIEEDENEIINAVEKYTITGRARLVSLIKAVKHIENHRIQGSIVECGVYKGGSIMAAMKSLQMHGKTDRDFFLYDTFEGMSAPGVVDKSFEGKSAARAFSKKDDFWKHIECYSGLKEVKNNISQIGYPEERIHYIKGKVENTIPDKNTPEKIIK